VSAAFAAERSRARFNPAHSLRHRSRAGIFLVSKGRVAQALAPSNLARPPSPDHSLLREPDGIWRQIAAERDLSALNRQLVLATALPLAVQGAVLGASSGVLQALSSAVKLPLLFLLTLAICLPTLYLFNLVFGSRLRVSQTLAVVLCAMATTAVLTLGFTPISVFFLLSARSYAFFKLHNVTILALTGVVGLRRRIGGSCARLPPADPTRATVLVFLEELRGLLDGAYDLAEAPVSPAASARLERLAQDVHVAVREMIETTHGQGGTAGGGSGELELRVEVLRALAREAAEP
jgi:hypothetical protein